MPQETVQEQKFEFNLDCLRLSDWRTIGKLQAMQDGNITEDRIDILLGLLEKVLVRPNVEDISFFDLDRVLTALFDAIAERQNPVDEATGKNLS